MGPMDCVDDVDMSKLQPEDERSKENGGEKMGESVVVLFWWSCCVLFFF